MIDVVGDQFDARHHNNCIVTTTLTHVLDGVPPTPSCDDAALFQLFVRFIRLIGWLLETVANNMDPWRLMYSERPHSMKHDIYKNPQSYLIRTIGGFWREFCCLWYCNASWVFRLYFEITFNNYGLLPCNLTIHSSSLWPTCLDFDCLRRCGSARCCNVSSQTVNDV